VRRAKLEIQAKEKLKKLIEKKIKSSQKGEAEGDILEEESEREQSILLLNISIYHALDSRGLIKQELEILDYMIKTKQQGLTLPQPEKYDNEPPFKTFVIDTRSHVKQNVFKPAWIQPTMSIEQAGEIEKKIAEEQAQKQKQSEARKMKKESDDEEEDIIKKREWDDWSDDNPRGSGNTGSRGYVY